MPYDSSGNASVTRNIAVTGQTVLAEQVNVPFADIQSMLSQVVLRSGVAPMTGALNMNSSKVTNVADPESATDGANKEYVDAQVSTVNSGISSNARKIETVNVNRLALLADKATSFRVTGTRTITLTAAATLLANWWCEVWAVDGVVTIDPDAAETINSNATLMLNAGQKAIVFCTGAAFFAFVTSDAQSGVQLQGYSFGLALSNNASDAANDIDIMSGKAAADTSPFSLMLLNSAITKRIDALWVVGSGNGGLDTGGVSTAGTYYIWLIQRSDTGVTDALFSLSNTAPTMPANYDRKRLIGVTIRSSSVNGTANSVLGSAVFTSPQQTISLGSVLQISHTLASVPSNVTVDLICATAEQGYSVGDIIQYGVHTLGISGVGGVGGTFIIKNASIVTLMFPQTQMWLLNKSTGTVAQLNPANWRAIVRAYP